MKYLFDQNISHRILKSLPEDYAESRTVKGVGLINADDKKIWDYAKANNFIIVTQDSDFNDLNFLYGFPPKVIWIRVGNLQTKSLVDLLLNHADAVRIFLNDDYYGCFEIQTI